jgi:hypothetical protein
MSLSKKRVSRTGGPKGDALGKHFADQATFNAAVIAALTEIKTQHNALATATTQPATASVAVIPTAPTLTD